MKTKAAYHLIDEILSGQVEKGAYGVIDPDRLHQALSSGPGLTKNERAILLLSPLARSDYIRIKNKIITQTKQRLSSRGIETMLVPLAASTSGDKHVLTGKNYKLILYAQGDTEDEWVILLQLDNNLRDSLDIMTEIRIVDDAGAIWLRGQPDANGELLGVWNNQNGSILDRARTHKLSLEVI